MFVFKPNGKRRNEIRNLVAHAPVFRFTHIIICNGSVRLELALVEKIGQTI